MDIEQNIEILWYIFIFLPQGYGALLRFVSKSFKEAVDTNYKPFYIDLISQYGLNPNLIEQFCLGCTIDMCSQSKSKWLKLLCWSRQYHPDTNILLLYACSLDDYNLIKSICNVSEIPPKNINMCLDCAFKNGNLLMIKKMYEYIEDLTGEHLLWLSIIHKQSEIFTWVLNTVEFFGSLIREFLTLSIIFRPLDNYTTNDFMSISWVYLPEVTYTQNDFMKVVLIHAVNNAYPFYYKS